MMYQRRLICTWEFKEIVNFLLDNLHRVLWSRVLGQADFGLILALALKLVNFALVRF